METPDGLQGIISVFGEAGTPDCHIGRVLLPKGGTLVCHKLLVQPLQDIMDEIRKTYITYYSGCGGGYANRSMRGSGKKSTHAWGIALDLNVPFNPLGKSWEENLVRYKRNAFVFTPEHPIIKLFLDRGFVWGGNFKHRKDPMHLQFCKNY